MNKKGFTIVEVLVSVSLLAVLLFVATNLFTSVFKNPPGELNSMDNIDYARGTLVGFVNELRSGTTGNDGSFAITQAGDAQIIFYSNYGSSGTIVKRYRYYLSGNTLYKGVITPTGSPLAYNISSEVVTPVLRNALANGSSPLFYYYDGNYAGSGTALAQPVNVNLIKYAKMNLIVKNQLTDTDQSTFTMASGTAIRNLKTNLGN